MTLIKVLMAATVVSLMGCNPIKPTPKPPTPSGVMIISDAPPPPPPPNNEECGKYPTRGCNRRAV